MTALFPKINRSGRTRGQAGPARKTRQETNPSTSKPPERRVLSSAAVGGCPDPTTAMNPVKVFEEWYLRQPTRVRDHIDTFVSWAALSPGSEREQYDLLLQPGKAFAAWLAKVRIDGPDTFGNFRTIGTAIMLRGLVTLLGFRDRRQPDDWIEVNENRARAREMFGADHPMGQPVPEEEMQMWSDSAKSWDQLCNSSLSDEAIDGWLDEQRRVEGEKHFGTAPGSKEV